MNETSSTISPSSYFGDSGPIADDPLPPSSLFAFAHLIHLPSFLEYFARSLASFLTAPGLQRKWLSFCLRRTFRCPHQIASTTCSPLGGTLLAKRRGARPEKLTPKWEYPYSFSLHRSSSGNGLPKQKVRNFPRSFHGMYPCFSFTHTADPGCQLGRRGSARQDHCDHDGG